MIFKYSLSAIALCALASCSEDTTGSSGRTDTNIDAGKELIALVGDFGDGTTRAAGTPTGFTLPTKVVMRIKAEDGSSAARYTQSVAVAEVTSSDDHTSILDDVDVYTDGKHSDLSYTTWPCQERYWDDAFGRESKLTVYAVAVPDYTSTETDKLTTIADSKITATILDQTGTPLGVNPQWYTITGDETKVAWDLTAEQSAETMAAQDLAYSNNIRESETTYKGRYHHIWNGTAWNTSMELGRMIWHPKTNDAGQTTGMFDIAHLVFKHGLTWITLKLKEGVGFDSSKNTDFKWTKDNASAQQNITLKGFSIGGDMDLSNGDWTLDASTDITKMYE